MFPKLGRTRRPTPCAHLDRESPYLASRTPRGDLARTRTVSLHVRRRRGQKATGRKGIRSAGVSPTVAVGWQRTAAGSIPTDGEPMTNMTLIEPSHESYRG